MSRVPLTKRAIGVRSLLLGLAWIVLTVVLLGAGELVTHSAGIAHIDRHITSWTVAHRTPALDTTMKVITWLGSWVAAAATGGIVLALVFVRGLPLRIPILVAVAWVGEVSFVNIVKSVVGRQRPPQILWLVGAHGASFPSGHGANATLVFANLALVSFLLTRRRAARTAICVVAFLGVMAVAYSRVELGVHWTTDVIASVLAVSGWLAVMAGLFASLRPAPASRSPLDSHP